jgi:hypothetical protein
MNILSAIRREARKLEKQLGKTQNQLEGLRNAAEVLGHSASGRVTRFKKRTMSPVARAKISRAAKRRWAKFRAQVRKVAAD